VWKGRAAVQNVLAIFDLDVFRSGLYDPTIRVSPCEAVVEVWMIGSILQLARNFERGRLCAGGEIGPEKFRQPQIRVFQIRLRVK
jgi:hypothetical protein